MKILPLFRVSSVFTTNFSLLWILGSCSINWDGAGGNSEPLDFEKINFLRVFSLKNAFCRCYNWEEKRQSLPPRYWKTHLPSPLNFCKLTPLRESISNCCKHRTFYYMILCLALISHIYVFININHITLGSDYANFFDDRERYKHLIPKSKLKNVVTG